MKLEEMSKLGLSLERQIQQETSRHYGRLL